MLLEREPPGIDEHINSMKARIIENQDNLQSESGPM
jgi:hypothetical protein